MIKRIASHLGALNYGCALLALCAATLPAQTVTYLYSFGYPNGEHPTGLVQSTSGDIYGITNFGTTPANDGGTVFTMTTGGAVTEIYNFTQCDVDCSLGSFPNAPLIQATDGNFYGTTQEGGPSTFGTVFKITPSGVLTTLYDFCSLPGCTDGANPVAGLVQGTNGNFYGTTLFGGTESEGTIFELTPAGTLTTLHSFCLVTNCPDGSLPYAGLTLAPNGNLYGVTGGGSGTAFEITPSGVFTSIHSFCEETGCTDGESPGTALALATDGNFYGTTPGGGTRNKGTIFKMTTSGAVTTLHDFCSLSKCADGYGAMAALVQGTDGNLYGTTTGGGASFQGTIFNISPTGAFKALYAFDNTNGTSAASPLIQDTDGVFYGTTYESGTFADGAIYSLSMGFNPFVRVEPLSSPVGSDVQILGTDLTGASSVTFDGTPASFTVNSTGTSITATVPSGTKRGTVEVVTPGGTLSSYPPFYPLHY